MSENKTPRTEASVSWAGFNDDFEVVPACVSRELETELAELKQSVSIKQQIGLALTEKCDELQKQLAEAKGMAADNLRRYSATLLDCENLLKELSEARAKLSEALEDREGIRQDACGLSCKLKEARAEIERLKHERTINGIRAHCEMEESDNEYVLQRNELEAAKAEIERLKCCENCKSYDWNGNGYNACKNAYAKGLNANRCGKWEHEK